MNARNRLLILVPVLSLGYFSAAQAAPWPKLETDVQKLEYGLALSERVKGFFTGTFNYGMEWWNIAQDQQRIQNDLRGLYSPELDNRPLSTVTVSH